ncbi:GNAT family N-acetyltransferase [Paenibacillus polymyxa]|nr:GNAT family N-acetyltransferase [Paenibacillus polymyxa]
MRKKGFASAMVSELCCILENEHLVPMLYADLKNSVSNQVYKNIAFEEGGKITDIAFE